MHSCQGRTGLQLVAALPSLQGKMCQILLGRPQADVCQSTRDLHNLPELPHRALRPRQMSSYRPTGAGRAILP